VNHVADERLGPVSLATERPNDEWFGRLSEAATQVAGFRGDVRASLEWSVGVGGWAPKPGHGATTALWELLATVAATDVGVARVLEPHLDALAILDQAPYPVDLEAVGVDDSSTWGVYAAEGPGARLTAHRDGDSWALDGVKQWCSLAQEVSHALVTAHTGDGMRRLFAVNLSSPGVEAAAGPWVSRGLRQIVSAPVRFDSVVAVPVGADQWYLTRPGFAWGGVGVAACWFGAAVGIARALYCGVLSREPDQIALMQLGAVDTALNAVRAVLAEAAACIDDPLLCPDEPAIIAGRARNVTANAVETTLALTGHGLGPAALTVDEDHARRVADLQIYLRQHHAERDDAALGKRLAARGRQPW
jgi:hypothetical protein